MSTPFIVDGRGYCLISIDGDRVERHKVIGWTLDYHDSLQLLPLSLDAAINSRWQRGQSRTVGLVHPDGRVEGIMGRLFADEAGWLASALREVGVASALDEAEAEPELAASYPSRWLDEAIAKAKAARARGEPAASPARLHSWVDEAIAKAKAKRAGRAT